MARSLPWARKVVLAYRWASRSQNIHTSVLSFPHESSHSVCGNVKLFLKRSPEIAAKALCTSFLSNRSKFSKEKQKGGLVKEEIYIFTRRQQRWLTVASRVLKGRCFIFQQPKLFSLKGMGGGTGLEDRLQGTKPSGNIKPPSKKQ